jgi:mannosidase alpha-like ER degradation enhancer 2
MMAPRLLSAAVPFFLFCLLLVHASMSSRERIAYRDQVHDMFFHGYHNYLDHAFPHDELKPLSCTGADTLGGYMLTLIDSLDSLAVFGAHDHFKLAVQLVLQRLPNAFDIDRNVSVFETNIRLMGALVSAHMLTIDPNSPVFDAAASAHPAQSALLRLAVDLGERLLPAFHTATGTSSYHI